MIAVLLMTSTRFATATFSSPLPTALATLLSLGAIIVLFIWSAKRPRWIFALLVIAVLLLYFRLTWHIGSDLGPGQTLNLVDVVWLFTMPVFFYLSLRKRGLIRLRLPLAAWAMTPYVLLAAILPIMGVLIYNFPIVYASMGFRVIQWLSFGFMSYVLATRYGHKSLTGLLVNILVVTGIIHFGYAFIQFLFGINLVGPEWVAFDRFVEAQGGRTWFYYPRVTGLMVNPNNFGLFGALLLVFAFAVRLARVKLRWGIWTLTVLSSLFAVVFSSSRSAVSGLIVGILATMLSLIAGRRVQESVPKVWEGVRSLIYVLSSQLVGLLMLTPQLNLERIQRLFNVFFVGIDADGNFSARVQMWKEHIDNYFISYPLGTMVSPEYVLDMAVDNYYVNAFVQGTPVFLLLFLTFLAGAWFLGTRVIRTKGDQYQELLGLLLSGWMGVIAGGSLGIGPPQHVYVMVLFWTVTGICVRAIAFGNSQE